jgi:predicted RNA methylase
MLAYLFMLITLTILVVLLSMVWPPDSPWSPWWRTSGRIAQLQCKLAKIGKGDVVYDMGCGDGTALLTAAHLGAKGVGIEIDLIRYWIAKVRFLFSNHSGKLMTVRKNFFEVDLSESTVIFAYLIPKTLARLKPKFLEELKPGTRIVTYVYKIDLPLIASDDKNELYVYEIPQKKK